MTTQDYPKVGHYVDFKDRDQFWQVGLILAKNDHLVKIRNQGWPQKYDELIPIADDPNIFKSAKIQPFRTVVRGCTGQKKNPGSREHWKFSKQDHEARLKKLEQYMQNYEQKAPEQLIQFFRGEHYFYIEFLMSNNYTDIEDLNKVYQYFFRHINLVHLYLNRILTKNLTSSFINTKNIAKQEQIWDKTFDNCYYELIEGLYNIAGLQDRLQCFSRCNEQLIKEVVDIFEKHQYYIFHQIQNSKLLQKMIQIIAQTYSSIVKSPNEIKLPFAFCFSLFQLFQIIDQIFTLEKEKENGKQLFQILAIVVKNSFDNLQPNDTTQVQIDREIQHILYHIRPLSLKYQQDTKYFVWPEQMRMKIAMLYLRCDKLDKKIKGVNKLKDIAQRAVKQQYWCFSQQMYTELFYQIKCLEELFIENQHIQMYKKSIEYVNILYKFEMISVEDLCFVWNTTINKHGALVTILYQFWIEMAYSIQIQDLQSFAKVVIESVNHVKTQSSQFQEFLFDLILAIINNTQKSTQSKNKQTVQINKILKQLEEMIKIGYRMLLKQVNQPYVSVLINKFSSIVIQSHNSIQLLQQIYQSLSKKEDFRVCLQILNDVYVNREKMDIFVPQGLKIKLIQCTKNSETTLIEAGYILTIIHSISNLGIKNSLKSQQLLNLWVYFTSCKADFKNLFFDWLLPLRNQQIFDSNFCPGINSSLNYYLKRFFLSQIFDNPQYINYVSVSKKEVSIILQLIIEVNLYEQKLQMKRFYQYHNRILYRIKQIELTNQNILWKIFQSCKQVDVIQYLCKYLTRFYLFFSPSLSYTLRKSRIDSIMEKLIKDIKDGFGNNNLRLMKSSLLLLKNIFEYVKEDERSYYINQQPSLYKVKLQIRFQNNFYKLELPQNQTVLRLKQRFAERLKLKSYEFKMLGQEQDHVEEYDYAYKNVVVSAIKRNLVEIVTFQEGQQSIYNFIISYIDLQTQNLFINMLQNLAVSEEVFYLLDELDLKINKQATISKINEILQKYQEYDPSIMQAQIFYHLLEIKIYFKLFQKENDIFQVINSKALNKILKSMNYPIKQKNQLHFIYRATNFVSKIVKKIYKSNAISLNLTSFLFQTVFRIADWQFEHKNLCDKNVRETQIKIVEHCNDLIQHLEGQENMIEFYVKQPSFSQLIQIIYLNYELQEIRMLFTEKLTKYLTSHHEKTNLRENVERYLLHLFIDQMYFKIKQKEMQRPNTQSQDQSVVLFSYVLSTLIKCVAQERFDDTQIITHVTDKSSSLFDACDQFFQSLRLFSTSDFDWNSLLCAHFNILMAIYKHKPSLIQSDMITFILQNCLALGNKQQKQPLCKKFEPINQAFIFLQQLLGINKDIQNIKILIQTLEPCHQVEIWRNPINWNVNIKKEAKQNFRGLLNPGCICYMNSLLQQLFMIKQFRISILDVEVTHPSRIEEQRADQQEDVENKTGLQENNQISSDVTMLQGLKELFLKMLYSQQNNINPTSFARTLKTVDKKSMIKMNQQMDIDQFEGILFQKIQKGLGQLNYRNIIKQLFGGVYSHQIISKECSHKSQRQEQFISMSLQVKQNIVKSFQSLVKPQILDAMNKYHCEKCDKKVKAEKIQTVKKFPPYLILCLKRFEFDYEVDSKIKINDYCQFPQNLNLLSFSQQEIIKNESQMENQDDNSTKLPREHFDYQLKGVVVHTGSADSGHYYSLIDLKGKWFQFNDQQVFSFDVQKLGEEAFGSKSCRYQGKIKNAYLLIYQRKNLKEIPSEFQQAILKKPENKFSIQKIKNKNRQIRKFEMVFSDQYDELIKKIATNLSQLSRDNTLLSTWFQFYLSYYFLVRARKETLQSFMVLSKSLENQISSNAVFCQMFLKTFTSPKFVQQYFVYNPMRDKCRVLAHMFELALKNYYEIAKKQGNNKYQIIYKVFQSLKAVFICDQPISELLAAISRFIQHLSNEGDIDFTLKIVQNFNFQKLLFNFEFNLIIDKKNRSEYQLYCRTRANDINFLAPLTFSGKKFNITNHAQNWKLVSVLLKINNIFLQSPEYSQLQEKDYYLNNMKYFNDYLNEANIQNKIINHIYEITTYRSIYYFYQALKQLQFNYKIFPFIEKALKDFQSVKYRPFFIYLQSAINDPQTPTYEKEKVLLLIQKAYRHNEKYFLEMDILHQWILRFVSMNEVFLQLLQSKGALTHDILDRINKNPYPIIADLGKKFKNQSSQRLYNKYLGILMATDIKEYDINSQRMKKQYFDITTYNFKPTKKYYPPQDRYDIGQQIEFFDISLGRWKKGRVIDNNFGQLTIPKDSREESHVCYWSDSQKLRPQFANEQDGQITPCDSNISYSSSSQQFKQPSK